MVTGLALGLLAAPAQALLLPLGVPSACVESGGLPGPILCGAWRRLPDLPGARDGHGLAWNAHAGMLLLYGGRDAAGQARGELWAVNPATGFVRALAPGPARADASLAWDEAGQVAYAFGGTGPDGAPSAGLWKYDFRADAWAQLAAEGEPQAKSGVAAVWDPVRSVLWTFGGHDGRFQKGDLHRFDPATRGWWLGPNAPVGRYLGSLVHDTDRDVLLLHGGLEDPGQELSEVWQYAPTEDLWRVSTPGFVPRGRHAAVWASGPGAMLAFGGTSDIGQRVADVAAFGPLDAAEVADPAFHAGLWVSQAPLATPTSDMAAVWDPAAGLAYLAGGVADDGPSAAVWAFAPGLLTRAVG